MGTGPGAGATPGRRRARIAIAAVAGLLGLVLLLSLVLPALLEPQRASRFLLDRAGASLGLEIRAGGRAAYRLRGTPMLELRDVSVREPGARTELLHADRILVSVPWSTIRARGQVLAARRLELDAPRADLAALQHWLATRPPSKPQLPTFTDGIRIRDGRLSADGWRIDGLALDLPRLATGEPANARLGARYVAAPLAVTLDLSVAFVDPDALVRGLRTGFGASGRIAVEHGRDWTMPGWIVLSGPLRTGSGALRIAPARVGLAAQWESGATRVPFSLGARGPLSFDGGAWLLADAALALRGRGAPGSDLVPPLHARGQLALGQRLVIRLAGDIERWPQAWPALPAPLDDSATRTPFALDYTGAPDLGDIAALSLRRGTAMLDARFRLADVQDWLAADPANPLPPLDAHLHAPVLELDGARLEGVEATLSSPEVADAAR
jgi:hypothetical protein